ncbi:hypothetical protein J4G52_36720 [Burkholderia cenocepacia]|uniref:hypothetical protein n=1 Tax=Burkholderia cenocepacia TaxID=95486 RepID=UPI001AA14784|nr:hypothetical protein [Burkholderia cenocepacia]MBO1859105.1 hypothetical protein [Burkholderia cenocepacia]MDR5645734.1 hypothetical protein [Burkholderia cenocepacia]
MHTTQTPFTCTVAGQPVVRIRHYHVIGGLDGAAAARELALERCSHEIRCPYLANCPMRAASHLS